MSKHKLRVCFRFKGMAQDENGEPCYAGIDIQLGETDKPVDYSELTAQINKDSVLRACCLDGIISPDNLEIITPEEYDRDYGSEEE